MEWFEVYDNAVTVIGQCPDESHSGMLIVCDLGMGSFRGMQIRKRFAASLRSGEVFDTKSEAMEAAAADYAGNTPFADGTKPFEVVFFLEGIGWQVFTSDTSENARMIKERMGDD